MELFRFDDATVERAHAGPVLRGLNWVGTTGQTWAIVGPTGSGKTTLLETLAGRHRVVSGLRTIPESTAFVGFREDSRLFSPSNFYYQQRFEFNEPDDCPTAREFLSAGVRGSIDAVVEQFHLAELLELKLLKLSNGQQRRLRIAKGLLKQPTLLLLDDPFSGLDTATRTELNERLRRLGDSGLTVVLTCRDDAVPDWVTNVLRLAAPASRGFDLTCIGSTPIPPQSSPSEPIIEMANVTVRHGGRTILDRVNWRVNRGERWAILGPNGSGKTTLLSLLCGDHPQAFANDIRLFGRRRGGGETIWEVKKRIGLVSPEMHQYFPRMLTAREAVASGFCDRFAPEAQTADQRRRVDELMAQFHLERDSTQRWWLLSTGTQRLLLFLRAVIKRPELLILDEPFQALDAQTIRRVNEYLKSELSTEQTLLIVVHDPAELPSVMTHALRLNEGRIAETNFLSHFP